MHKNKAGLLALTLGALMLSGCGGGGGQTPTPSKIEAKTVAFDLRDKVSSPLWTYGPGTLTLRRAELSETVGPVVTQGPIDNAGRGNIQLPGEDQGVLAKADQAVGAAIIYLLPKIDQACLINVTESNMNARALYISQADFSTQDGGKSLRFYHIENVGGQAIGVVELLVFVTADNMLSGNINCSSDPLPFNLAFKRGWNSLTLSYKAGLPISVRPVSTLSLAVELEGAVATPTSTP